MRQIASTREERTDLSAPAPGTKKPGEEGRALLFQNTLPHPTLPGKPHVPGEIVKRSHGPRPRIVRAEDQFLHSCLQERSGAHGAGLQRDVESTSVQAPRAENRRCPPERHQLRVSEGIGLGHATIPSLRDDISAPDDHGTHRNIPLDEGPTGLLQGKGHKALVVAPLPQKPLAGSGQARAPLPCTGIARHAVTRWRCSARRRFRTSPSSAPA